MAILLVEDDTGIGDTLRKGLTEEGFAVHLVDNVDAAIAVLEAGEVDLVVLDLGLPGKDGVELLHHMRAGGNDLPVIVLTARGDAEDRVAGFKAGADDYVVKPFSFVELVARIRAICRRVGKQSHVTTVGDLEIDRLNRRVTRGDREIVLTQREFDLLAYLAAPANGVVTREMLARDVWQVRSRATPLDNVIDVHISRLRAKLGEVGGGSVLRTIRGVGYVFGEAR